MTEVGANPLLEDEELQAALKQIEQMSEQEAAKLPSLDEDSIAAPPAVESPASAPAGPAAGAPAKKLEFKLGSKGAAAPGKDKDKPATKFEARRPTRKTPASEEPPPEPIERPNVLLPTISFARRVLRWIDAAVEFLNLPGRRLAPEIRDAIGVAALLTLAMSLGAWLVLPRVLPYRDAVRFLEAKVAEAPPTSRAAESPKEGGESAATAGEVGLVGES